MPPPPLSTLTLLAVGALILWRVYTRFRKLVGRQRLTRARPWITLAVYAVFVPLLATSTFARPERLCWLAASLVLGVTLSVVGLRCTKFEAERGVGLFYTPNAHLGLALSALFVARIGYRFVEVNALASTLPRTPLDAMGTPATLAIFGLLAGYYSGYAVGLIRWRSAVFRAKRLHDEASAQGSGAL